MFDVHFQVDGNKAQLLCPLQYAAEQCATTSLLPMFRARHRDLLTMPRAPVLHIEDRCHVSHSNNITIHLRDEEKPILLIG
jgi:hypothetical protein